MLLGLLAGGLLDRLRQAIDLYPILPVGGGEMHREQVAERVDGCMQFGAFLPCVSVVASSATALRCTLQGTAVQDHGAWLASAAFIQTQQRAQVVHDGLEDAGLEPATRLLVDGLPAREREVRGQHAPFCAGPHHPAQAVEDRAQVVPPLRRVFAHEGEVRGDQVPFLVADVTRVGFARWWSSHVSCYHPSTSSPQQALSRDCMMSDAKTVRMAPLRTCHGCITLASVRLFSLNVAAQPTIIHPP